MSTTTGNKFLTHNKNALFINTTLPAFLPLFFVILSFFDRFFERIISQNKNNPFYDRLALLKCFTKNLEEFFTF